MSTLGSTVTIGRRWLLAILQPAALAAPLSTWALDADITDHVVVNDRYEQRRIDYPQGVSAYVDVPYAGIPGFRPLSLDLYVRQQTKTDSPKPLILYIHGGGWRLGSARLAATFGNWPETLAAIAAQGFVTASVAYRLSGEAPFPAAIQDVKAAISWLRDNADRFNIDRNRVILWGASAGAHLAALAATSCGVVALELPSAATGGGAASSCVQGAVLWYGPYDFRMQNAASRNGGDQQPTPEEQFLGCRMEDCPPSLVDLASPASHIDAGDPPMLLIHGQADAVVPVAQSRQFAAELRQAGIAARLIELPGVDHSFIGADAGKTVEATRRALNDSMAFTKQIVTGSLAGSLRDPVTEQGL